MSYYLIIICAISQVKQCLLISTDSQQYSAGAKIQIAHQLIEWIIYNPLSRISPECAICFYRSLISSSKCCYVRVGCQKRRRRVYKRDTEAWMRTGTSGSSPPSFVASLIACSNFCSRIPVHLRTPRKCIKWRLSKATHFYVMYRHDNRINVTIFAIVLIKQWWIKISYLHIKRIYFRLQRHFMN